MLVVVKPDKVVASCQVLDFNPEGMFIQKVLFDLHFITDNIVQTNFGFSEVYVVNFNVNVFVCGWVGIYLDWLGEIKPFSPAKIQVRLGLRLQSRRKGGQYNSQVQYSHSDSLLPTYDNFRTKVFIKKLNFEFITL